MGVPSGWPVRDCRTPFVTWRTATAVHRRSLCSRHVVVVRCDARRRRLRTSNASERAVAATDKPLLGWPSLHGVWNADTDLF